MARAAARSGRHDVGIVIGWVFAAHYAAAFVAAGWVGGPRGAGAPS